jgi:MoaA/NifB/PqqE/SkfB family radical SAM enzyme
MKTTEVLHAWAGILSGNKPSLSIEITKECPLRCPGCYAYEPAHLGLDEGTTLRQLADYKGDHLVENILGLVDKHRPLHLSLVGGDPLVRYRELQVLLPQLDARGIHVQVVTSAFRVLPKEWAELKGLNIVVSIDGLQPEHDERRKPATYERILKNIAEVPITVHCTVTAQMMKRAGYLEDFLRFWSTRPEVKRVWMSLFTPQKDASGAEILSAGERAQAIDDLFRLRTIYPVLDMNAAILREFQRPPRSPRECIFARTTETVSADLKTRITPCQFGGTPDCERCGCIASMGLAAVGHYQVAPGITAGKLFFVSELIGKGVKHLRG